MCGAAQKGRPTGRRRGPDLDGVRLALRRRALLLLLLADALGLAGPRFLLGGDGG